MPDFASYRELQLQQRPVSFWRFNTRSLASSDHTAHTRAEAMAKPGGAAPVFTQTIHVPSSANDCPEWQGREIQLWGKPRFYEGLSATQARLLL